MVRVVTATFADDPAICEIAKLSPFTKGFVAFRRYHQEDWTAYEKGEIGKALQGSKIVGFVYVKQYMRKPGSVLHYMGVLPYRQSRGVGTALLKWARGKSNGPVVLSCEHANADATEFYRRSGLRPIGEGTYGREPDLRPYTKWEMS